MTWYYNFNIYPLIITYFYYYYIAMFYCWLWWRSWWSFLLIDRQILFIIPLLQYVPTFKENWMFWIYWKRIIHTRLHFNQDSFTLIHSAFDKITNQLGYKLFFPCSLYSAFIPPLPGGDDINNTADYKNYTRTAL